MAAAPSIEHAERVQAAYTAAHREVRRTQAQARRANKTLAVLRDELAALGIRLTIEGERDE